MAALAVVPARSGSKGLPNKNITDVGGRPLLEHSIRFAQALGLDTLCSTDSRRYAEIAEAAGAIVPRLRSADAANDTAMEPEVLDDLDAMLDEADLPRPEVIVWLRPTFVFRSLTAVRGCMTDVVDGPWRASRVVTEGDARLYTTNGARLVPTFETGGASMVRRQDVTQTFRVFNTDVFRYPGSPCPLDYLGSQVAFRVAPKLCSLDVDDADDLVMVRAVLDRVRDPILP